MYVRDNLWSRSARVSARHTSSASRAKIVRGEVGGRDAFVIVCVY